MAVSRMFANLFGFVNIKAMSRVGWVFVVSASQSLGPLYKAKSPVSLIVVLSRQIV